jgi:pimeloyl-ACP methyl ester carboxylesterase
LVLSAILGFAIATAFSGPAGHTATAATALSWQACGAFECATLAVPLDYTRSGGRQIDLALIRQRAKDPGSRIGSLLLNPGGPGGSGVGFLRDWAASAPREVQNRFDLVSFDPRGVGQSAPLLCHDDIQKLAGLEPMPKTPQQWQSIRDTTKAFADLCAQRGSDILAFVGSDNVARDMDQIRQALGEEKLTYVGFSYGTVLGQLYADMFPDKVRAIVLDGPEDFSLSADELSLEQARGFEGELDHFIANCRQVQCLPVNRGDPGAAIDALIAKAEAAPIPAPRADRPAGAGETVLAIFQALYTDRLWPQLARAIDSGLSGDGSGLVRLADDYLERNPDGSYSNLIEMYTAVSCVDFLFSRDPAYYEQLAAQFAVRAPHFGVLNLEGELPCAFWPVPPNPLRPPRGHGAPPVLVIGTTGDPATPFKSAVSVSRMLESAVLLTFYGDGHTAFTQGSPCVDNTVVEYVVRLQPPAAGTTCGDASKGTPLEVGAGATPIPAPVAAQAPLDATQPGAGVAPSNASARKSDGNGLLLPFAAILGALFLGGLATAFVALWRRL